MCRMSGYFRKTMIISHANSLSMSIRRRLSFESRSLRVDPSRLVSGLDLPSLEGSPETLEYLKANFPGAFVDSEEERTVPDSAQTAAVASGATSERRSCGAVEKSYPRNIRSLSCYHRELEGSRCSRYLRRNNMIPGILYGSNPRLGILSTQPQSKLLVQTEARELQRELDRYHHHIESRVYNLTVYEHPDATEGTVHRVIPKNLHRHPVHGSQIYCVNYLRYHARRPIKLPITYINEEESPALKRDGFIVPIKRYVECFVDDGVDIPEKLELECTALKLKEVIRKDRIILPDGVTLSDRVTKQGNEFIIGVVFGRRRDEGKADEVA